MFDSGDTIRGSVLADATSDGDEADGLRRTGHLQGDGRRRCDGSTAGNHEFNYGLSFLAQVTNTAMNVDGVSPRQCAGPKFPLVLSNVYSARDGKPIFKPERRRRPSPRREPDVGENWRCRTAADRAHRRFTAADLGRTASPAAGRIRPASCGSPLFDRMPIYLRFAFDKQSAILRGLSSANTAE